MARQLPTSADELFGPAWDHETGRFTVQETYIVDYKDRVPPKFSDPFGASIVRLALAFYNTFGGLIIFGVTDRTLEPVGPVGVIDVEAFNALLTEVSGIRIECLAREYDLGTGKRISVLLVPRRGLIKPARLLREIGPYSRGLLWYRDRHQVIDASAPHFATLFSSREHFPSDVIDDAANTIYGSLPPSPATMHQFVGRETLLLSLWEWFIFGDQPRLYLHGPGGSGKSTLAFEFARLVADGGGSLVSYKGEKFDYVVYISGKENELDPYTGSQQDFLLRQFDTASAQFAQILIQSGQYVDDELRGNSENELLKKISDLFNSYSGLIVIDDIDALSRVGEDTGEEPLLMEALKGAKRTRILYTLRTAPANALRSALRVPGLEKGKEFNDFLSACCEQFGVALPEETQFRTIARETSSLPLLVETVVGLRRVMSSFREALAQFKDRGDDDARRYLYQREYDRLSHEGKSREVLAALSHLKEPVSVTILANLLGVGLRSVTDAISEAGSIFLTSTDNNQGETRYQLAAPSKPFIKNVSERLNRADQIKRRVQLFQQQGAYTPAESALIVRMERLAREARASDMVSLVRSLAPEDPVLANPKILALTGQAYSRLGPNCREEAREAFRAAEAMGFRDIFMMRSWYSMELSSGYGTTEAERICNVVVNSEGISSRYKSEFLSKLGQCYYREGAALIGVSREKGFSLLRKSIHSYLEALWVGRHSRDISPQENLGWMERPVGLMIQHLGENLDEYMDLIGELPERKHDVSLDGAILLLTALRRVRTPADARGRTKMGGLCRRAIQRLDRFVKDSDGYPGLSYLIDKLKAFHAALGAD